MMVGLRLFILCLILLLVAGSGAAASTIRLEAENLVASYSITTPITMVPCGFASNGYAIEGFDEQGEWIELRFELDSAADCLYGVRSAGVYPQVRQFSVEFVPSSGQSTSPQGTLVTLPGSGIG
jgi:hypothetical protein